MKSSGVVRRYPAGTPISGLSVTLHDEDSPGTPFATVVTDANGAWSYSENGNPRGAWYWQGIDTGVTPNVTRRGSSRVSGSGGVYSLAEVPPVLRTLGSGVVRGYLNGLATALTTGLNLSVATGAALIQGIPAVWHSATTHTVTSTRDGTNPKACYLVVEVTMADGTAILKDVCGTAAASPTLPTLTKNETTYQQELASFRLPTGSAALSTYADARTYAGTRNPVVSSVVRRTDPTSTTTTTSTSGADLTSLTTTVTLLSGVPYDLEIRVSAAVKIDTSANTVSLAGYLNGVGNISDYVSSNLTDYAQLSNHFFLEGVVGTGATVSCGARWKVSGGTGTATTGVVSVVARPRS